MPKKLILAIILIAVLIFALWLEIETKNLSSFKTTDKLGQILQENLSELGRSVQKFKQDINFLKSSPSSSKKLTNEQIEKLREKINQINNYER